MYEVVDTENRDERGVFFKTGVEAVYHAETYPETSEAWQVADDEHNTRMVLIWPR